MSPRPTSKPMPKAAAKKVTTVKPGKPINVAEQLDDIEKKVDQDIKLDKQQLVGLQDIDEGVGALEDRMAALEERMTAIEETLKSILDIFTETEGEAASLNLELGPPQDN